MSNSNDSVASKVGDPRTVTLELLADPSDWKDLAQSLRHIADAVERGKFYGMGWRVNNAK